MELKDKKWENYSTPFVNNIKKDCKKRGMEIPRYGKLQTLSLGELKEKVDWLIQNQKLNNKDIYKVPVFINYNRELYVIDEVSSSASYCSLGTDPCNKFTFVAPDSRPETGEYWKSRGASDFDCSGFVVSKLAGERLLRLVKYVLETDEPKSWLDFREREPNWIQFKFSAEEFDVTLLDELSREFEGIITEEILRKCKL